jgi:pimeloyl-ACP methyl ester carboxylesterase
MPTATANGATLFYELRGSGPPVLFIQGATGDGGTFDRAAELLADEFTVLTYDRRGNSRSPLPAGQAGTSIAEQADDAAALLRALDLAPATIFGTSGGAIILLELLLRHPEAARAAIVHEPPILSVLPYASELSATFQAMTEDALARGGPRYAMEGFLRGEAGDETFERLDPELRARMLGNAEWLFSTELALFAGYRPDPEALGQVRVPVAVVAGRDHPAGDYHRDAAQWVADRFGAALRALPDKHAPYLAAPRAFADALRTLLRQLG